MSKLPFKERSRKFKPDWNPKGWDINEVQCPLCEEWFTFYDRNDLRGIKLHIRKWASKEATAYALGEIKKMPHLKFWKENSISVNAIPKGREWRL